MRVNCLEHHVNGAELPAKWMELSRGEVVVAGFGVVERAVEAVESRTGSWNAPRNAWSGR